jgi:hypothetical protein
MVEERVYIQRSPGAHLLAAVFVSLLIIAAAMWAMGVMTVAHPAGGPIVITIDFSKAERASQEAVEKTGEALERAGHELRDKASRDETPAAETPPKTPPSDANRPL